MAIDVLTGMRVFTAVVDAGSFAKAADKLDLSRGMTSRYVAQIEAHLGVRLLNRTTRRLSLTETGNDYYQRATQVLALVDEAEHAAAHEAAKPSGTLRVNTSVAFGAAMPAGQSAPICSAIRKCEWTLTSTTASWIWLKKDSTLPCASHAGSIRVSWHGPIRVRAWWRARLPNTSTSTGCRNQPP
jgi:hypothetical protein